MDDLGSAWKASKRDEGELWKVKILRMLRVKLFKAQTDQGSWRVSFHMRRFVGRSKSFGTGEFRLKFCWSKPGLFCHKYGQSVALTDIRVTNLIRRRTFPSRKTTRASDCAHLDQSRCSGSSSQVKHWDNCCCGLWRALASRSNLFQLASTLQMFPQKGNIQQRESGTQSL